MPRLLEKSTNEVQNVTFRNDNLQCTILWATAKLPQDASFLDSRAR